MSEEEFIRYLSSLIAVVGLGAVSVALGEGLYWLLWGALPWLVAGTVVAWTLWNRHFSRLAELRYAAENRPERAKKATEESPY